jgi:hypothetical protein
MEVVMRLLDLGADVNAAFAHHIGRTALQAVLRVDILKLFDVLLGEGHLSMLPLCGIDV